jgi:geranylgeranyl diphosphate synthase type I
VSSYQELFTPILAAIDAEMREARREQQEIAPILWDVIDYQFGWDLPPAEFKKVSGKKIRPLLMALVAKAVCGEYQHVLPAGASLEFIHNFTLIHDDVMDDSPERRHRPTIWTKWGKWQAINSGDGLYALANLSTVRLLKKGMDARKTVRAMESLSRACLWTAEGQILDMDFEHRETVLSDDYITMITNKSATLIECAAFTGAMLSTDDEAVIENYANFARTLGIAFQVRDDYLGVWGDEAQTGKSVTSDIRAKKKSYPVLVGFERASQTDRADLRQIYEKDTLSDADVNTVLAILDRVDARQQTDKIAEDYYQQAMNYLDATGITNETQDVIRGFAAFLIQRAY